MILDRFPGVDPDPNAQALRRLGVVSGKAPLDIGRAAYGVRHILERGHDAVAGVLDLAPAMRLEPAPNNCVVRPNQFERRAVAEPRRHLGRTDDVGEHDRAQRGVDGRRGGPRPPRGSPILPRNASTVATSTGMIACAT